MRFIIPCNIQKLVQRFNKRMKVLVIFRLAEQWSNIAPVINSLLNHCIHANPPFIDLYRTLDEIEHGGYTAVLPDT